MQQMTSFSGQNSAVLLRFDYQKVESDLALDDQFPFAFHGSSLDGARAAPIYDAILHTRPSARGAPMPVLIRPAQTVSRLKKESNVYVAAHYRTKSTHVVEGIQGPQTLRLVPDVPAKPIFIRSCNSSSSDEFLVFEIAGLADSISISSCNRIR